MYSQIEIENKCLKIVTVVYFLNFGGVAVKGLIIDKNHCVNLNN